MKYAKAIKKRMDEICAVSRYERDRALRCISRQEREDAASILDGLAQILSI